MRREYENIPPSRKKFLEGSEKERLEKEDSKKYLDWLYDRKQYDSKKRIAHFLFKKTAWSKKELNAREVEVPLKKSANSAKKNRRSKMEKTTSQKTAEKGITATVWAWVKIIFCLTVIVFLLVVMFSKGCVSAAVKSSLGTPSVKEMKKVAAIPTHVAVTEKKEEVVVAATAIPTAVPKIKASASTIYVFNAYSGDTKIKVYDEHGLLCTVGPRSTTPVTYAGHAGALIRFEVSKCEGCHEKAGEDEDFSDGEAWVVRFSSNDKPYLKTKDLSVLPRYKKG